jgi:uncharacterized delta-60 repeat protein
LQGDKIIQSGECYSSGSNFCLVRYKADGSLDTYTIYDLPTSPADYARALATQTNGYILQGGYCTGGANFFCLTRYQTDGSTDFSFNSPNGYQKPNIIPTNHDYANTLVLQSDGKILQGGYCKYTGATEPRRFCVMRYNSDGSIDSGFGSGGYVLYHIPVSENDDANSLILQSDGKIIQGGTCTISGTNQFCIVRYNANGSIDSTFGTNGYFIYQVPGTTSNTLGRSIVIQSDGEILLGGTCDNKFCIVKIQ